MYGRPAMRNFVETLKFIRSGPTKFPPLDRYESPKWINQGLARRGLMDKRMKDLINEAKDKPITFREKLTDHEKYMLALARQRKLRKD
jgi:hypothetical protein